MVGGLRLQFSAGFTRRANCALCLRSGGDDLTRAVGRAEALYRQAGLPCRVKVTSDLDPAVDTFLDARGYRRDSETRVRSREPLPREEPGSPPRGYVVEAYRQPRGPWLAAWAALSDRGDQAGTFMRILARVQAASLYVVALRGRRPVGCARAVATGESAGLFELTVAPEDRRRGIGVALTRMRLVWAAAQGARRVYCHVLASNRVEIALQDRLGFTDQYSYWYRVARLE